MFDRCKWRGNKHRFRTAQKNGFCSRCGRYTFVDFLAFRQTETNE